MLDLFAASLHLVHAQDIFDIFIGALGASALLLAFVKRFRNLFVFLQAAVLLLRMIKHFLDTHPELKSSLSDELHRDLYRLYHRHVTVKDPATGGPLG